MKHICKLLLLLVIFSSPFTLTTNSLAQQSCAFAGNTLNEARGNYTRQCTLPRVDCDPFGDIWVCASFSMTSSEPPALTIVNNNEPVLVSPPTTQPLPATSHPVCLSTGSDADGDGFGWENGRSCIVTSASLTAISPAPSQNITRTESALTVVAPAPAPVSTPDSPPAMALKHPVCTSTASDPDGDGFGWENNLTCRVDGASTAGSVPTANQNSTSASRAADITDLILVTGQSNALGAGTEFDRNLDRPNDRVFAFTNNGWQVANLNQIWDLDWHPRNHPETDPSNNFALHFGKNVASNSDRVVGFVLVTAPGAPIEHWKTGGSFYQTMQSRVLDAINQLPHKSAIDGVLWHQGESDGQDIPSYSDALYTLINSLRNEPWANASAPFICGETKIEAVNNRLNGLNRDSDPTTACVRGIDLPTLGDDRHFTGEGLRTLGARYADAYLDIVE